MISALQLRGYNVPEDFSVLGFDDIPFANNFTPGLTTIRQPRHHIGEMAMNILLDRLANRSLATQTHLLHGDLIVRESCGGVSRKVK
ncbi:substrate-binding domain-containing protein [Roseibium salinum]|nr:substrate-binding domain-containing protein [Roseibium salinum]